MMGEPSRGDHSFFKKKIDTLVQVDGNKEEFVALPASLGMALSALNTIIRKLFCTIWQVLWSKEEPATVIT
jgi:hypothetical protein